MQTPCHQPPCLGKEIQGQALALLRLKVASPVDSGLLCIMLLKRLAKTVLQSLSSVDDLCILHDMPGPDCIECCEFDTLLSCYAR